MKANTLKSFYKRTFTELESLVKESGVIKEGKEFEFVKVKIFELITYRVISILDEMNVKNASTLHRGLNKLIPTKINDIDELVNEVIYYHKNEKLAIRKFRHSDKTEIKQVPIEDMFKAVLENTSNTV